MPRIGLSVGHSAHLDNPQTQVYEFARCQEPINLAGELLSRSGIDVYLIEPGTYDYHGSGGANTTTKQNKRAILYPDADIVWTGHTHKAKDEPEQRYRVTDADKEFIDSQYHNVSGTFKAEHRSDYTGWADLREHKPPFYGGWWLQFAPKRSKFLQIDLRKAA